MPYQPARTSLRAVIPGTMRRRTITALMIVTTFAISLFTALAQPSRDEIDDKFKTRFEECKSRDLKPQAIDESVTIFCACEAFMLTLYGGPQPSSGQLWEQMKESTLTAYSACHNFQTDVNTARARP